MCVHSGPSAHDAQLCLCLVRADAGKFCEHLALSPSIHQHLAWCPAHSQHVVNTKEQMKEGRSGWTLFPSLTSGLLGFLLPNNNRPVLSLGWHTVRTHEAGRPVGMEPCSVQLMFLSVTDCQR